MHIERRTVKHFGGNSDKILKMSEPNDPFNAKKKSGSETVGGILVQSEKLGFERSELLICPKCSRSNAPDRFECIYCGTLVGTADPKVDVSIDRTPPELWENGFNIIVIPDANSTVNTSKAAKVFGLEPETLTNIINAERPLPLMRVKNRITAEAISDRSNDLGLKQIIVADSELRSSELPVRLRGLEFGEDRLTLIEFNTSKRIELNPRSIELIVTGKYFSTRTEVSEQRRKKKDPKVLNETETSSDEDLIDIYIRDEELGFRISSTGFDFSCLGAEKGMIAAENMNRLAAKLRSIVSCKFIDDYAVNIVRLGNIWELESRKDSYGLQRSGFGRTAFESVATNNNLNQFTKFSRLNRILNEA